MAKKFFLIHQVDPSHFREDVNPVFSTKENAANQAKKLVAANQKQGYAFDVYILEAIAVAAAPIPDVAVTDLPAATTA